MLDQRRVVVVTGSSAGVGRAVARMLAEREQARIGLIARGRNGSRSSEARDRTGDEALVLPADVADAQSCTVDARSTRSLAPNMI